MNPKTEHDHIIPLIGGPLCGDSVTLKGKTLYHTIPMVTDNKEIVYYNLVIKQYEDRTDVYYSYLGDYNG